MSRSSNFKVYPCPTVCGGQPSELPGPVKLGSSHPSFTLTIGFSLHDGPGLFVRWAPFHPPPSLPFADAGYPAYVYEFQHRPSSHARLKPEFVKADHGDEIVFVFGKPFLGILAFQSSVELCRTLYLWFTMPWFTMPCANVNHVPMEGPELV